MTLPYTYCVYGFIKKTAEKIRRARKDEDVLGLFMIDTDILRIEQDFLKMIPKRKPPEKKILQSSFRGF